MLQIPLLPVNYLHEGAHYGIAKLLGHDAEIKSPYSFSIISELNKIAEEKTDYSFSRIQEMYVNNRNVDRFSVNAVFREGTPVYDIILYSLAPTIVFLPILILMYMMLDITIIIGILMMYIGFSAVPSKDDLIHTQKYVSLYLEKR
jgi:hypothetical protein